MRTYAAYLRKSRSEEGETLEEVLARHKSALMKLAKDQHIGIVDWYEEVVSGESVSARPQVQALLEAVSDERYHAVLCMDIDRLGRGDMQDQGLILSTFRRSETKIITPRKTYDLQDETDETMTEFLAFFARQEYKMIRKRMRRGTLACLEEGGYVSNAPYGYEQCRINKKPSLRIVPDEARFVRLVFDRYCSGIGATAIADELNALGSVPRRNDRWTKNSIRYMLQNPVYTGKTVFNRYRHTRKGAHGADRNIIRANPQEKWLVSEGLHEAIISQEQFDLAKEVRTNRYVPGLSRQDGQIHHQFAGIFRCSKCGRNLYTLTCAKGGPYLACYTPGCCAMVKEKYLEEYILSALHRELDRLEFHPTNTMEQKLLDAQQIVKALEIELDKLSAKKQRLYDFLEDGTYDRTTFISRMGLADTEERALNTRLTASRKKLRALQLANPRALTSAIETALSSWPTATPQTRNQLLKSLIADAEYTKEKKSKPRDFHVSLTLRHF